VRARACMMLMNLALISAGGAGRTRMFLRHLPCIAIAPIPIDEKLQEVLSRGERRRIGNCVVHRKEDMLRLERAQEPGNIQSEWDIGMRRTPDYAGTMASMAREALVAQQTGDARRRVLMLGLGGGTIAGQLLLAGGREDGAFDSHLHVTAIEADVDVAQAACRYFVPQMFEHSPNESSLHRRLRVLNADAVGVVHGSIDLSEEDQVPYDVIIEDFAYEDPGRFRAPFWQSVRERFAAPQGCVLLINTLYSEPQQMATLQDDLRAAGWKDVRQRVDRGLQILPWERQHRLRPEDWRLNDNMIFSARTSASGRAYE